MPYLKNETPYEQCLVNLSDSENVMLMEGGMANHEAISGGLQKCNGMHIYFFYIIHHDG